MPPASCDSPAPCTRGGKGPIVEPIRSLADRLRLALVPVIFGQEAVIEQCLAALLAGGHALLEGPPGTAKTLLVRLLARAVGGTYRLIQVTPDLLPSDVIGTNVFDPRSQEFRFHAGPIFGNLVLADEVNRAPAKTQAALLEAMQEEQVTIDGTPHPLPRPFAVFATQNPVEHEGTYPLPEAQLDRFMCKVVVPYPPADAEARILKIHDHRSGADVLERMGVGQIVTLADLDAARAALRGVTVRDEMVDYVVRVIRATRDDLAVQVGASPRAGLVLLAVARAFAAMRGREFVVPDDVKAAAVPVLRHRLVLAAGAEIEGETTDAIVTRILGTVEVPR